MNNRLTQVVGCIMLMVAIVGFGAGCTTENQPAQDLNSTKAQDPEALEALMQGLRQKEIVGIRDLTAAVSPDQVIPIFCEFLADKSVQPNDSRRMFCARYLLENPTEEAVETLAAILTNEYEELKLRELLLYKLARVGGSTGADAVIKALPGKRLTRSLLDGTEMEGKPFLVNAQPWVKPRIVAVHTTNNGVKFCAFTSRLLGGFRDLWIGKYEGGRYVDVAFTGEMIEEPSEYDDEVNSFNANWIKLIDEGKWIEEVLARPDLWRDSDGDGLTDIAEVRIGTDPKLQDTDSDGKNDMEDGSPLVPPRRLTRDEQAIKAAITASYGFNSDSSLFNFEPEGSKPFELNLGGRAANVERPRHPDLMRPMTDPMVGTLSARIEARFLNGTHSSGFAEVVAIHLSGNFGGRTWYIAFFQDRWVPIDVGDAWVS